MALAPDAGNNNCRSDLPTASATSLMVMPPERPDANLNTAAFDRDGHTRVVLHVSRIVREVRREYEHLVARLKGTF